MLEARKILYFICALIILLSTLLPDLILIKSEVFAATDEITTEKIENEDESTVTNEIETNDKTSQKVIMPIDISKFSLGEKVAILINNNNEIKVVPTSYSNIEKLCDEETTVYFGIIVENGIEIEVEKTDDKILEYTNKSKEELSKIIQIVSKEELEETDENKKAMMSINEDNGIMPISALSGITGLNTSAKFGVCEGSYARFGHEMHYMTTGGVTSLVFCMEYSKTSPTGKEYYYGSDYTTRVEETLKELSLLIYFGHTAKYGTGVPTSDEAWKTAIAAQQMCWSVSSTEFDTKYPLSGIWKSEWLTKSSLDAWRQEAIDRCCEYYNCSYSDGEGFTNWSTSKVWNDIKVNVGETHQLQHSWFEKFGDFSVEKDGVTFSHTNKSNIISIKANKATSVNFNSRDSGIYALTPEGQTYDEGNTVIYIEFSSSSVQDMLYTNYLYPIEFKINVTATGGKIKLKKVNTTGAGLQGAVFSVIANEDISSSSASYAKGDEVGTITTLADGTGSIENLPVGKYKVVEKSVPTGYIIDKTEHEATITEDIVEVDIGEISNSEPTGELKFKKINDNGDGISGVEFGLFADEDITNADGSITYYTAGQKVRSVLTGTDGTATIGDLKLGRYYIQELSVPNGYLKDSKKRTFNIGYKDANTPTIELDLGEIISYEPTGKITVTKTNKNNDNVSGAKFLVTATEDIKNKAGTVTYFHAGDEVGTIEASSNGSGTLENLHLGRYTVTEVYAPTGYLLNTESKEVELKYADENTSVVFDSTTIINDEPTGLIDIKKADVLTGNGVRPDGTYHHGDATFSGAEYTLYANEKITNYAKTVDYYNKNDAIAKFTFDATGTPTVKILNNADGVSLSISGSKLKGLPMGKYYLRETEIPKSGYLPDTTTYEFSVDYVDQYTADIDVSQTVKEQVERAKFELIKVSTDMNQVAPVVDKAQFTAILEKYVKYYGGFDNAYDHISEFAEDEWCTFETDLDGHGISDFLAYGKYVVSETYVPDNDINRVEEFTVTIDENSDGVIKEVIANDSPFTAYIKMVKKDKKTGKVVTYSNATFELYKYDRATREWNLVQCKVGSKYYREWTTDEEGKCETETTLDAGTYRLVEKKIPQGFNELEDYLIFYVNSMNETVEYDLNWDAWITVEVENEQPTGRLIIDKSVLLREDVDKSLIDASDLSSIKFRLKAKEDIIDYADGSIIYKKGQTIGEYNVDADGDLQIAGLPMGSYTLQEINFLDGTVINSEVYEINFEQTDTKTKEYVIEKDIENETTLVEISKTDITGENEIPGAKLQVIDEDGNVVDEWISKKKPHTIEGLTVDKEYTLREKVAANGYVKATDIKFTIENTADIQKVQMKDEQVSANKVNVDKETIIGAKLQVIDTKGNIIDSWTTDGNIHYISNLEEGKTYILQEIKVPEPYVKATDIEFTVPSNKTNLDIEMVDKKVAILKTDVDGNPIEGAELQVIDEDGNVIDEWTSTLEEHYIKGLEENKKYKVYEKTAPQELKKTYKYIEENYGVEYINKTTSILGVDVERIRTIENRFKSLNKLQVLQASISRMELEEIEEIIEVCRRNGIELTGIVFRQTAEEIEKIVEVCRRNGIEPTGNVFLKPAEEIEKIIGVCRRNGIELTGSAFLKPAEEIEKIIEICRENGIELTGTVFLKPAEEIEKIVEVCKENGIELTGNVFLKPAEEIEKIVKICRETGIEVTGSVFLKPAEEIEKIVEVCRRNEIELTGSVFLRTAEEIEKIVKVCRRNEIEVTGSVFYNTAEEIERIIKVCKENGIGLTGTVFKQPAEEIEKIVKVCRRNEIELTGSVFLKSAEEIEKIVKICRENEIELTGSIFLKPAKKLKENIDYIKEEFGTQYLLPLIVSKDNKTLRKVLPYLKEKGYIEYIKVSASILSLTLEQIQERERFIEEQGQEVIDKRGKFNSIFGLSRKKYEKLVQKAKENRVGEIGEIIKGVTIKESKEAGKVLGDITRGKKQEEQE